MPIDNDVDAKIAAEAGPVEAVPANEPRPRFQYRRLAVAGAVVFVILAGFLGTEQVQAATLLSNAQALNKQNNYSQAYDQLKQADALWSFPTTKQSINDSLAQTARWQKYQDDLTQATSLIQAGKYSQAVTLLKDIKSDYPAYKSAADMLTSAQKSQSGVLAETGMSLPQAGDTPSTSPSPTPSPTANSSPSSGVATTKSAKSASPSSSAAPPPSYVITNSYCTVDTRQATDLYQVAVNLANTCQSAYPQIMSHLGTVAATPDPHVITLTDSGFSGGAVAYTNTATGSIAVSISYMRSQPTDMGMIVHELTHVVQSYSYQTVPVWIVEGMADYMRYTLGYSTSWSYFHCDSTDRYTSGYGCGAALLKYIERVYRPTVVKDLHATIRANQYSDNLFINYTGKTLEQLYAGCRTAECQGGAS